MPTKHQLARFPDHVEAIGLLALETVDLELELALLFSRMLMIWPRVGEAIYMTPLNAHARIEILQNAAQQLLAPRAADKGRPSGKKAAALKKVKDITKRA